VGQLTEVERVFDLFESSGISWKLGWNSMRSYIRGKADDIIKDVDEARQKQLFLSWSQDSEKRMREGIRKAQALSREEFASMLEESECLVGVSKLNLAAKLLGNEKRWNDLLSQRDRQELFHAFLRERSAREESSTHRERLRCIICLKKCLMCKY
jgi:hypothetical protein